MTKKGVDTNRQKAIVDMASSLAKVFKKYSRSNREKAWSDLTDEKGQREMKKILQDPDRSLNGFPKLAFRENSFAQYKANKEMQEFDALFDSFCENVILSGLSFDEFWSKQALPILMESDKHQDEMDLLVEFNWGKSKLNPGNWFAGNKGVSLSGEKPDPMARGMGILRQQHAIKTPGTPENYLSNMEVPESDPNFLANTGARDKARDVVRQRKLGVGQKQIDQSVANLKQQFSQAMQQFLKAANDSAMRSGDKIGFIVARKFYNKLMKTAQPVLDDFALKAKAGTQAQQDQQASGFTQSPSMPLAPASAANHKFWTGSSQPRVRV